MANRLDLIKFTSLYGKPCDQYGMQEIDKDINLIHLYDHQADQLAYHTSAEWDFVRTLGEIEDSNDFWNLVAEAPEITPIES